MLADLQSTFFGQIRRGKNVINVVRLLAVPLQEKCWAGLFSLLFLEDSVILAFEPHRFQLGNYVRVIPPTIRLIPEHIAIKIAENYCLWPAKVVTVDLKILPELPHITKCF